MHCAILRSKKEGACFVLFFCSKKQSDCKPNLQTFKNYYKPGDYQNSSRFNPFLQVLSPSNSNVVLAWTSTHPHSFFIPLAGRAVLQSTPFRSTLGVCLMLHCSCMTILCVRKLHSKENNLKDRL